MLSPLAEYPAPEILKWLEHAYSLREELDPAWAVRPAAITRHWDRTVLVLEDPGGVPLDQLPGQPLEVGFWLRLAINLSTAIDRLHQRGIIHKDIKPANVLVDAANAQCWLRGFLIASRLPRERQGPEPPEFIAGTLPYIAPEQTGRMNRSIDSRSDLYSLGVTLYEMLTGSLPFTASDPMEWVHCHIARQPVPPGERRKDVPETVSAIILKLLSKTAEDRYQTAAGLVADLKKCLGQLESHRHICSFSLGTHDISDRLLIPEKLYGRDREIKTLLDAFDQVVATGRPNLVLVSGYSGIGKSSVVNELHKVLVLPRGLFASGKFDQYKRDIPYATLAQAFQSLVRSLLSKGEADLQVWRDAFSEALGPNGLLIFDLVPELKLIIGEQPSVPDLAPQDAQRRFRLVFRRFINVFARPEHPLALFLDDLQWLDAASLDLLEDLSTRSDVQHLMLIGAYRDNEVTSTHPLMRKLEAIRQAGAIVHEIVLASLTHEDLGELISDSLHCEPENRGSGRVTALAHLVHEKTGGNPFFAIQFLSALVEEALLIFDHSKGRWSWDLSRIQAKGYTDNVVDLMVGKLTHLPVETQETLKELACLGNSAEITTLSVVHGTSEAEVQADLWEALRLEYIVCLDGSYKFVHDHIQEAAYSLVPEELRAEAHLRIGRLLTKCTPPERLEEFVFEIVNQLDRGALLINSQGEREQLAELNLIAGKRARASTAYHSALKYFMAGISLLPSDSWTRRHELAFALEVYRAECEFLTGELAAAEERLTMLSARAANTVERANVECLRIDLYANLDQADRAVAAFLDYLRHLRIEWSAHPTEEEARREYERIWSQLGSRPIEELSELPLMSDPVSLATLDVLTKVYPSVQRTDANLLSMTVCLAVNLSLEQGNSDGSCVAYVWFGKIAGPQFGDYKAGFRFGQLGYELVAKRGLERFQARTYLWFAQFVVPWTKHVQASRGLIRQALEAATKVGDLTVTVYSFDNLNTNFLARGFEKTAHAYLRDARYGYLRWGADGKVRQLEELYPQLKGEAPVLGLTSTIGTPVEHLDLDTVLKVSQAVSGEVVLEKLIDMLMRTAIEHAGAERGLLILSRSGERRIEAEATTSGDTIVVRLLETPVADAAVPDSIVHFVARTRESVILDDASAQNAFSADAYFQQQPARSILCLPLINQAKLIGLLYLENNLAPHVFTPTRMTVLKLLASQAAISLENTRLYRDLEEREAKIRRLVDSNIVGIFIWNLEGEIIEANEAFLRMVGYSRQDLLSGRLRWTDLTPADWHDRDERAIAELKATGIVQPFEKEYLRKDGDRVPVLIGAASFEESETEGVAFVLDLSERKRSEEALRRSEAYLAQAQRLSRTGSFWWKVSSGELIWSDEAFRIMGYDRTARPSIELVFKRVHPEDIQNVEHMVSRATREGMNVDFEHRLLMSDGSVKHVYVVLETVRPDPENREFVGTVMDITARKQAEEAVSRAQAELAHVTRVTTLGELTASIAHEINQPLSAIGTNADASLRWLARDSPDLEEVSKAIHRITRDAKRASAVVSRMRALFKKAPTAKEPLDINELIQEVLILTQSEVKKNLVSLRIRFANDLPLVMGDKIQLQQVILNLLINAIQAMSGVAEGPRDLEVSSEKVVRTQGGSRQGRYEEGSLGESDWNEVLITVRDSGPGLDPQRLDHLFDAFYTTKPQGMGMGLSISRSIIEAHSGRLWANANSPRGAVFQFTLPVGDKRIS